MTKIKNSLRPFLPESVWTFFRFCWYRIIKGSRFAINDLDRKLEPYLNFCNGFYVELGVNDGFSQSNTFFLEKKGWSGILVEPCPNLFFEAHHYRGKRNKIFCNACVPFGFENEFVTIEWGNFLSRSSSLPSDIQDLDRFNSDRSRHLKHTGLFDIKFGAKARPLNDLLLAGSAPEIIDFLSLDVEGAELSVLKGIDFSHYSFNYILVECRDIGPMEEFFQGIGYILVAQLTAHDFLFSPKKVDDTR